MHCRVLAFNSYTFIFSLYFNYSIKICKVDFVQLVVSHIVILMFER